MYSLLYINIWRNLHFAFSAVVAAVRHGCSPSYSPRGHNRNKLGRQSRDTIPLNSCQDKTIKMSPCVWMHITYTRWALAYACILHILDEPLRMHAYTRWALEYACIY